MNVVVKQDEIYRKEIEVRSGDRFWMVIIEREFVDDFHARWRWYFWQRRSIRWNPPPLKWPTWERALEAALDHIAETLQKAEGT